MTSGTVLITGASSGIGEAAALHLDRLGLTVIAAVRKTEDGERLQRTAPERLSFVLLDVTDADSIATAAAEVDRRAPQGLAGLVNNAGIAQVGPLEFIPMERLRRQFEVNFFGHVAVTQAFLPAIRRARGRVVNISSMAGKVAAPYYGPYTASKHAMEAFSDALRNELAPWGIAVVVIEPGSIDTPIWDKGLSLAQQTVDALPERGRRLYGSLVLPALGSVEEQGRKGIPVEHVSKAIEQALTAERPRVRYVVGRDARLAILGKRLLPDRVFDRLLRQRMGLPGRNALAGTDTPEAGRNDPADRSV